MTDKRMGTDSGKSRAEKLRARLRYIGGRQLHLVRMSITDLREHGPAHTADRMKTFFRKQTAGGGVSLSGWLRDRAPSKEELAAQRGYRFEKDILLSVVVPVCGASARELRSTLESVLAQTYAGWELLPAGAGDPSVSALCREYAAKDDRVRAAALSSGDDKEKSDACPGAASLNAGLAAAKGDYIAFVCAGDALAPSALFEIAKAAAKGPGVIYTDEALTGGRGGKSVRELLLKQSFAVDDLRACDYIGFFAAGRSLLDEAGPFRGEYEGALGHDMLLRLTALSEDVIHIPQVLYLRRERPADPAEEKKKAEAGRGAVLASLKARGLKAAVETVREAPPIYRLRYEIAGDPLVSVIIPTCDRADILERCLESIAQKTTYAKREIILIENNSKRPETFSFYEEAEKRWPGIRILRWPGGWNWPAINDFGVKEAAGDYILLLNNDTEVISPGWIEEMLMYAQRPDVGAVGAMLYYPDERIQHAGVILRLGAAVSGHAFYKCPRGTAGSGGRLLYAQDITAVTGACLMTDRRSWEEAGGLDEELAVSYNDVDFCLRLRQKGLKVVFTPHAELYHHESLSRGYDDTPEKLRRVEKERAYFLARWKDVLDAGDPYYNPNLSLERSYCLSRKSGARKAKR